MKNLILLLMAVFSTSVVYSQDSVKKDAVSKQSNVNTSSANSSDKSKSDKSLKGIVSVNTTDTLPHQNTGDYNDNKRIIIKEGDVKDEPK